MVDSEFGSENTQNISFSNRKQNKTESLTKVKPHSVESMMKDHKIHLQDLRRATVETLEC